MGNSIYMMFRSYSPNTAITNRMLAYLSGIDRLRNCRVNLILVSPNSNRDVLTFDSEYISVTYWWRKGNRSNLLRYLYQFFCFIRFYCSLRRGDVVYLYNLTDILGLVLKKKGIKVFNERTEHPDATPFDSSPLLKATKDTFLNNCKNLEGLIVISQALKQYFISEGIQENKIHVVDIIVDEERFKGLKPDTNVEKYIAYCGNASNNKDGVDQLIKAFSIVKEAGYQIKLYIIGPVQDNKDYRDNLELIKKLNLEDYVVFTGIVSSAEMPQMLVNAQILALDRPDNLQAKYGFPTKLGEYLISGAPVVATAVGDIPLLLEHKKNIILSAPNNQDDFANNIMWVLDNPEDAKKIGVEGRRAAQRLFNAKTETNKLLKALIASKK